MFYCLKDIDGFVHKLSKISIRNSTSCRKKKLSSHETHTQNDHWSILISWSMHCVGDPNDKLMVVVVMSGEGSLSGHFVKLI